MRGNNIISVDSTFKFLFHRFLYFRDTCHFELLRSEHLQSNRSTFHYSMAEFFFFNFKSGYFIASHGANSFCDEYVEKFIQDRLLIQFIIAKKMHYIHYFIIRFIDFKSGTTLKRIHLMIVSFVFLKDV